MDQSWLQQIFTKFEYYLGDYQILIMLQRRWMICNICIYKKYILNYLIKVVMKGNMNYQVMVIDYSYRNCLLWLMWLHWRFGYIFSHFHWFYNFNEWNHFIYIWGFKLIWSCCYKHMSLKYNLQRLMTRTQEALEPTAVEWLDNLMCYLNI